MMLADLQQVMGIERRAYPFPWTEAIMRDCIRVGYPCRLMELGGEVVGYGIVSVAVGEGHILNLCVSPDHHNRGLGRLLLAHLVAVASTGGAANVFLEVRPSNHPAIHLYQSFGFCEVGLRRGYYPDARGREDALVMAMAIPSEATVAR